MQELYNKMLQEKELAVWRQLGVKLLFRASGLDFLLESNQFSVISKGMDWEITVFEYLSTNLLQIL